MRVHEGRGDWPPRLRIESVIRLAFIGDSHAYGAGVAPDETLPANVERKLNELSPGWPVECVNLGISGYNLWNSWLGFKDLPQVYDGVVLVLCNNDADFFNRTFHAAYPQGDPTHWESGHQVGELVARCFDDIALYSREHRLPVAVVYSNPHNGRGQVRIGEILGELCGSRGICFVDALALYLDRKVPYEDLLVSSANFHPSALAHRIISGHLAVTLKRQGWLGKCESSEIAAAPDRILATTRAMVDNDHYAPDVALHWALRVLDTKSRVAERIRVSDGDSGVGFTSAVQPVSEALTEAADRWHIAQQIRALAAELNGGGQGVSWGLTSVQELKLRLDELGFALAAGNRNCFKDLVLKSGETATRPQCEVGDFNEGCNEEVARLRGIVDELRKLTAPGICGSPYQKERMLADLEVISRLVDRAELNLDALKISFLRVDGIVKNRPETITDARAFQPSQLISDAFQRADGACGFLGRWEKTLKRIREAKPLQHTTVAVTISGKMEGKQKCFLGLSVEYGVPDRLPHYDAGVFWLDGSATLLRMHVPTLYSGRIALRSFIPDAEQRLETTLIKIEISNQWQQRRSIDPASFYKDQNGRMVSPVVYLI